MIPRIERRTAPGTSAAKTNTGEVARQQTRAARAVVQIAATALLRKARILPDTPRRSRLLARGGDTRGASCQDSYLAAWVTVIFTAVHDPSRSLNGGCRKASSARD